MTPLVCQSGVELLNEYLEGALEADLRAAIDAHVAGCDRCQAFVASYSSLPSLVRDATRVEMPPDLEATLLAAVRAARVQTREEQD